MPRSINFVRERQKKISKSQVEDLKWRNRALIGLSVVMTILIVVVGFQVSFSRRLNAVQAQQETLRSDIASREDTERAFVVSINKLSILSDLYQERRNKQQAIQYFTSVFGPDVLVRQVSFNAGEQLLTFRLQADDIFVLERVFDQLRSDDVRSRFAGINSSDLRRNDEGKYEMTVAVTLSTAAEQSSAATDTTNLEESPF